MKSYGLLLEVPGCAAAVRSFQNPRFRQTDVLGSYAQIEGSRNETTMRAHTSQGILSAFDMDSEWHNLLSSILRT